MLLLFGVIGVLSILVRLYRVVWLILVQILHTDCPFLRRRYEYKNNYKCKYHMQIVHPLFGGNSKYKYHPTLFWYPVEMISDKLPTT